MSLADLSLAKPADRCSVAMKHRSGREKIAWSVDAVIETVPTVNGNRHLPDVTAPQTADIIAYGFRSYDLDRLICPLDRANDGLAVFVTRIACHDAHRRVDTLHNDRSIKCVAKDRFNNRGTIVSMSTESTDLRREFHKVIWRKPF